jgi:hypothetical protein
MTKLQPPVGTMIETQEEAISTLLLPKYVEWYAFVGKQYFADADGRHVSWQAVASGWGLPYTVVGIADGFTSDPNYGKTKMVEVPADSRDCVIKEGEGN